jgi:hypothetical protein
MGQALVNISQAMLNGKLDQFCHVVEVEFGAT